MNNDRREIQRIEHPFRRSTPPDTPDQAVLTEYSPVTKESQQIGGWELPCGCLTVVGLILFCLVGTVILIWNL